MKIMNGEPIGNIVELRKTNPLHYDDKVKREPAYDDVSTSFADSLMKALGKVNDLQTASEDLSQKMMYEPESVDIHTVMIRPPKAELVPQDLMDLWRKRRRKILIHAFYDIMGDKHAACARFDTGPEGQKVGADEGVVASAVDGQALMGIRVVPITRKMLQRTADPVRAHRIDDGFHVLGGILRIFSESPGIDVISRICRDVADWRQVYVEAKTLQ